MIFFALRIMSNQPKFINKNILGFGIYDNIPNVSKHFIIIFENYN